MDDPRSRPPLADDPDFLASLSELDRGLGGADDAVEPLPRRQPKASRPAAPSRRSGSPPQASSGSVVPPPAPASGQSAPAQRRVAPAPPPRPAVPHQPPSRPAAAVAPFPTPPGPPPPRGSLSRRPLLDLFPPAPKEVERPPDPLLGTSPGPRLPRARPAPEPPPPPSEDDLTYETFYGLHDKPFRLSPDPRFLYHNASHDRGVQTLLDAIGRRDGIIVVAGEVGVGKTMLCRAMVDQLDRRTLTSRLGAPFGSFEDLLKTALVDFGVIAGDDVAHNPLARATRPELIEALRSFVRSLTGRQASSVMIVDDAQELSVEALQQLHILTDFDGASLLQIVLVGRPNLVETLERTELKPLAKRVTLRYTLAPLQADEIAGYVTHRLAVAGTSARVEFDDDALERTFDLSGGNPRLVNVICDRALTLGQRRSASVIDADLVEAVAEKLGIAPPPDTEVRRFLQFVAAAVVLTLLMLVGAGAAVFVFRDQASRAILQWEAIPPAPAPPVPRLPVPLTAIPEPPA